MRHNVDYSAIDLLSRASELGNHYQKHIINIENNFDVLVSLIDEKGLTGQFHLLRFSYNPVNEMKLITQIVQDRETKLQLLGCYFSLQFLLMNLKAIDVLQLNFSTLKNRYDVFKTFLLQTGNDFRLLSGAYMKTLLDIFLPKKNRPQFVICGVGTRVDQDDIDLGIIDKSEQDRERLTAALGKLNTEMLKYACPLHFHLSEHVGTHGYSASVEEYHRLLDNEIQDFVMLSEMINAVPIFGKMSIFNQFKNEILDRYYYHKNQDNKYHEGFLRGLLGEIRDLIMREPSETILDPKNDGLRMIKSLIHSIKTWKVIEKNTSLEVLEVLMDQDNSNIEHYYRLYQSLTFLETFRFLYQLFVVQEDEVDLGEDSIYNNLEMVAAKMGYERKSYSSRSTQLIIHYQDHLKIARIGVENLIKEIVKHLGKITVFYSMIHSVSPDGEQYKGDIAIDLITKSGFFKGIRFWDDILIAIDSQTALLNKFLQGFRSLSPKRQKLLVEAYIKWGYLSPYTLVSLITIIVKHKSFLADSELIREFLLKFVCKIKDKFEDIEKLCRVFSYYPKTMYDFISLLPEGLLGQLIKVLSTPVWDVEINLTRRKFLSLCKLCNDSSFYFKRFIDKVFNTYPEYIKSFDEPKKFRQISEGLLRNIGNFKSTEERLDRLNNYYDFEFMRLGINAIKGMSSNIINKEFTILSDSYIQVLFDLCREEVSKKSHSNFELSEILAIYAAGGHARGQAFDDDYDLIIILNSDNPKLLSLANNIIVEMNKHIVKRSIMPHYRFADRFRNYVTTFEDLKNLFEKPDENVFIDKSQLLGARIIVGSARFETTFVKEIIKPYIFDKKEEFIKSLVEEIKSRYKYHSKSEDIDLKEFPGGLRDLENFLFILQIQFNIRDSISDELFLKLSNKMPEFKSYFGKLMSNYNFLKQVRDLYHLMVSNNDTLQKRYLKRILTPLSISNNFKINSEEKLYSVVRSAMTKNLNFISSIIKHLYNLTLEYQ